MYDFVCMTFEWSAAGVLSLFPHNNLILAHTWVCLQTFVVRCRMFSSIYGLTESTFVYHVESGITFLRTINWKCHIMYWINFVTIRDFLALTLWQHARINFFPLFCFVLFFCERARLLQLFFHISCGWSANLLQFYCVVVELFWEVSLCCRKCLIIYCVCGLYLYSWMRHFYFVLIMILVWMYSGFKHFTWIIQTICWMSILKWFC